MGLIQVRAREKNWIVGNDGVRDVEEKGERVTHRIMEVSRD